MRLVRFGFAINSRMLEHLRERKGPFRVEMKGFPMEYRLDANGELEITKFDLKEIFLVDMAIKPGKEETLAPDQSDRPCCGPAG